VKKITRTGILSLVFVFTFMFMAASAEVAAAGRFISPTVMHDIQIQAKHDWNYELIIHISKHELTLKKGESYTLKASLLPSGKSVSVEWWSSNDKIAIVSNAGKVTAVAPGTAIIDARCEEYYEVPDKTGFSNECFVTVPGGSKDAKPLGTSDLTYSYGETKLTVPTSKYDEAFDKVKKVIGGYTASGNKYASGQWVYYSKGLLKGSKDISKAHTIIYINRYGYGFIARGASPIKTSRGIAIGANKNTVQQKYGTPTLSDEYTMNGKKYDELQYWTKEAGKSLYKRLNFFFDKKGFVTDITFYVGGLGDW